MNTDVPIVEVALGTGNGVFAPFVTYPVAGDGFTIGDVNGDGIPDIVTNGVTVLFGDGKGGFPNRRDVLVEATGNLIVADFNGNGIPDIVLGLGNPSIIAGAAVTVLSGLGKEDFAGPPISLVPNYDPSLPLDALTTADVNGDGIPDVISADIEGHVSVLLGVGDGSFQSSFQFLFTSGLPYWVAVADFNHDGKPDLAVVGSGYTPGSAGEVDILLGNGNGTFQQPIRIAAPMGAYELGVGDFNGDGNLDLAVLISRGASGVSDSVTILLGGRETAHSPWATPIPWGRLRSR